MIAIKDYNQTINAGTRLRCSDATDCSLIEGNIYTARGVIGGNKNPNARADN